MIDLQEFLRRGGADLPSVAAKVGSAVTFRPGDALLAVGSLVEGLGSCKSDLDLYLITDRVDLPAVDHVAVVVGKCLVDVLVVPSAQVDRLLARFDAWAASPWNVMHAAGFTLAERTMLHRLARGLPLFQAGPDGEFTRRPSIVNLARLKLHAARHNGRTIQVDMIGHREEGDHQSLVFAAQDLLGDAIDGLLAGHLITNPLPKWRSRLLGTLPADWQQDVMGRPSNLPAKEFVWQLHRSPDRADECLTHALRITTFARQVFSWAELCLVRGTARSRERQQWPRPEAPRDPPLPFLDLDVDYMLSDGAIAVARLNDFGEPVRITRREFELCLLFDGTTTAREAEWAVDGDERSGGASAERLAERLSTANLSAGRYEPLTVPCQ